MMKYFIGFVMIVVLTISCKKNDGDLPVSKTDSIVTNTDSAKLIIIASRELDTSSNLNTCLTCYNPDRSIRWKRDQLGTSGTPDAVYAIGRLCRWAR